MQKGDVRMKNDRQNTKMLKGIKAKLLKILLPCIAIAIISIIVISYMASKKIIVQEAKNLLRAESKMNAKELETWTTGILNTLDMLQNTLETVPMDEETEKRLINNLKALANRTIICITHRPAAVSVSDKAVKIEHV